MTEAQVESAYGEGVAKLPAARNRRTEIVESLHLKTPVVINGIAMAQSFAFSRADMRLEIVVLRANLSNVSTERCQGTYQRIRQAEVDRLKAPIEEKPTLRYRREAQSNRTDLKLSKIVCNSASLLDRTSNPIR